MIAQNRNAIQGNFESTLIGVRGVGDGEGGWWDGGMGEGGWRVGMSKEFSH
jgi:hypothetical protein